MTHQPSWRMVGQSVRGASHHRTGLPNQDALGCLPPEGTGPPLVLAVSDGHGSAKSFRSDRGSRFAVAATTVLLRELVEGRTTVTSLSAIKRVAEERLPQELVRRWQEAVDADLRRQPFTEEELTRLAAQRGEADQQFVLSHPRLAYGATVLGVLVERDFLLYLQLGDGDILAVTDQGQVVRPFDRDSRLIANETTSLCMQRAWREVRLHFQARYGPHPAMILAATDGYANSFVNDAAFLRVGPDILEIFRREGVKTVEESLGDWLVEASEAGSGDDITVGILYRTDALTTPVDKKQASTPHVSGQASPPGNEEAGAVEPLTTSPEEGGADAGSEAGPVKAPGQPQAASSAAADGPDGGPEWRSRMLAQLKHKGPSEPTKQGHLRDLVDADDDGSAG